MNNQKNKKSSRVEIVNFNDMVDPHQEEIKKLKPEESEEIRKKLMWLLGGIFLFGIIALIIIIFGNDTKMQDKKEETNVKEEITEETTEKEIPDGVVSVDDDSIAEYKKLLIINPYDTIFNGSLKNVFNTVDINSFDNNNKLYFASKSEVFQNYIKDVGVNNHQDQCNGSGAIEIDASVIKEAMEDVFGNGVTYQNIDFYYPHYTGDTLINVYKLSFINGKYTMTCVPNYSTNANMVIQSKIEEIKHENDQLVFSKRVVFISKQGVFADPQNKTLITKDPTVVYDSYIKKGTIYKFIFTKNNDKYYLSNIQK